MKKFFFITLAALMLAGSAAQAQAYRNSRYYNERTDIWTIPADTAEICMQVAKTTTDCVSVRRSQP